jgi:hypothetical protein
MSSSTKVSPRSSPKVSPTKKEILNTGVKIEGRSVYFTKGLKNPVSGFFVKTADGKKNKVLLKNITNDTSKKTLTNLLDRHATAIPSGKKLNPLTGRFVKGNVNSAAGEKMSPSILLKMLTDFFKKYDGRKMMNKKENKYQTIARFAHENLDENRNETARNEDFTNVLGDNESKYPIYVSIEPTKDNIAVNFYLNHTDSDVFFTLNFKLNTHKQLQYATSSSFFSKVGKLQSSANTNILQNMLGLKQYPRYEDKSYYGVNYFEIFKKSDTPTSDTIIKDIKSSIYDRKVSSRNVLTVNRLYYLVERYMVIGWGNFVSWKKEIKPNGNIADTFGRSVFLVNPHGKLSYSAISISIEKSHSNSYNDMELIIEDEFENKFTITFDLRKNNTVEDITVGPAEFEDEDDKSDFYIHDQRNGFITFLKLVFGDIVKATKTPSSSRSTPSSSRSTPASSRSTPASPKYKNIRSYFKRA